MLARSINTTMGISRWAVTFLIIALVAGLLGFGLVAGLAIGLAKMIFFLFLALCAIAFWLGRRSNRTRTAIRD